MADQAGKDRLTQRVYLANVLAAEVDERERS